MHSTVFDQMAGMVLARDLQRSLGPELDGDMSVRDASLLVSNDLWADDYSMFRISLVTQNSVVIGWTIEMMLDGYEGDTCASCVNPVEPHTLISADTSALEIADLFGNSPSQFYFVLDHNEITGLIQYEGLFSLPFKLCLLALTLGLENSALNLLLCSPRQSWACLSEARREKAIQVYERRFGGPPDPKQMPIDRLLGCTMFCDKSKMLSRRRILPDVSTGWLESVFFEAERVRNACVHTEPKEEDEEPLVKREHLARFIADIRSVTMAIESSLASIRGDD